MDGRLKQRMVGATVLIALCVIIIPALLDGSGKKQPLPPLPEMPQPPVMPEPIALPEQPVTLPVDPLPDEEVVPDSTVVTTPTPTLASSPETSVNTDNDLSAWVVQVGSFAEKANAEKLAIKLRANGFSAFIEKSDSGESVSHRVRIGPEMTRKNADDIRERIAEKYQRKSVVMRYYGTGQ